MSLPALYSDAAQRPTAPHPHSCPVNCVLNALVPNTMSAVPRARFYRVHFTNALWGKKFYDKLALLGT